MDKHELILNNTNLVYIQAKRIKRQRPRLEFDELIGVGNLALTQAANSYNEAKGDFKPYANRCIANAMADHARGVVRSRKTSSSLEECDESVLLCYDDRKSDLEDILSILKPEGRQIITWRVEGYTQQEIGERLGVSGSRVSQMEERCRNTLRSRWI